MAEVNRGWAVDYGKTRFDYLVQEVDLMALLVTHGCANPESFRQRMDSFDVYRIMHEEAMVGVSLSLADQEPASRDTHMAAAKAHREERERLLSRVLHPKDPAAGG